ncbi:hypothetical protein TWF481_011988 [Arthrobotrys musiformis]|uniref:RCC1-like domain-containing protein n=1 Tax=Arthrobotrys musiformis TaxID=47236 RepID=A0AAV9VVN6_9PEZI
MADTPPPPPSSIGISRVSPSTSAHRLFSFGSNSLGQLGICHINDAHAPTEVFPPCSSVMNIKTGGNQTFIYSDGSNTAYATGDNTVGQCGVASLTNPGINVAGCSSQSFNTKFTPILPPSPTARWQVISSGWQFSIFVSSDHAVYSCGLGPRGELGLGSSVTEARSLTRISSFPPPGTTITQIVSCVEHSLVLLSDGRVYGWGNGRKGQLGALLNGEKFIWEPAELQLYLPPGFEVAGIAAGREFSAFISPHGEVHVIGSDKSGAVTSKPSTKVPGWKTFAAGWRAIYILADEGKVLAWGGRTYGQLPPEDLPPLEKLAVGSEHAIGVGLDGKLYAWGWGEHGNCGPLSKEQGEIVRWKHEVSIDGLVEGAYKIDGIAAGCATSWVWVTASNSEGSSNTGP